MRQEDVEAASGLRSPSTLGGVVILNHRAAELVPRCAPMSRLGERLECRAERSGGIGTQRI
jgi:hypothetical protein